MKRIKASNYSITLSSAVVFTKPKAIPSCKFCGSTELGERITNCNKRKHLQSYTTEYILGCNQNGFENFIRKIEYDTQFEYKTPVPASFLSIGENSKSKHFFIHNAWDRTECNVPRTVFCNIIFEFSYINKQGIVELATKLISGSALISMLSACNIKKGPIFIFDKTPKKEMTNSYTPGLPTNNEFQFSKKHSDLHNNFETASL